MKYLKRALLLCVALGILGGCGDNFPDEEMHLGIENKVRPFAVVVEPPEAAPGDTVTVTFLARTPDIDELDITWRVALDFNTGMYETDEVERNYASLPSPEPMVDEDGFLTQSFQWVVPESALLDSSALPEVLDDPAMVLLAEELMELEAGSPVTKVDVDSWLKDLSVDDLAGLDPATRMGIWALADRFACQVRLRAQLRTDLVIDVTRNLTIRHTGRLAGPNTNTNPTVSRLAVAVVEKADATRLDLENSSIAKTWYPLIDNSVRLSDRVQVPIHAGWTYYLKVDYVGDEYTSPFDPNRILTEDADMRWYYYRQDNTLSAHNFFVAEDGGDAEMFDLSDEARINPAGVGSVFRFLTTVMDDRGEWVMYHAAPGSGVEEGVVEFVAE